MAKPKVRDKLVAVALELFHTKGFNACGVLDIAEGTVRVAASRSRLAEYPLQIAEGMAHVEAVAGALSTFGAEARTTIDEANAFGDADTADLFTEISRGIDKWLWFVEAHSQATK
jgi:starvation-inducible DNA-binding protein